MAIVKIVQSGWANFNGDLEGVQFKNGVSTDHLNMNAAERLGSLFNIVDAETGEPISAAHRVLKSREQTVSPGRETLTPEDLDNLNGVKAADPVDENQEEEVAEDPEQSIDKYPYTREQLEKVADEGGISKLREFASEYDVKGKSIPSIIDGLMKKKAEQ